MSNYVFPRIFARELQPIADSYGLQRNSYLLASESYSYMAAVKSTQLQAMPASYVELLRSVWRLNRVHNGDEFSLAIKYLTEFCAEHLRGEVKIHDFTPGDEINYWIIPPRWNLRSFSLLGPDGRVIATHRDHPLVVCPFSIPIDMELDRQDLIQKTVSREDLPDAYCFWFRRMYRHWEKDWSLSLPANVVRSLEPGRYRVHIDAEFTNEPMPVFEYYLQGTTDKTIFMAGHLDHPGMINDSLSGCFACLQAIDELEKLERKTEYSYRILLLPEIIGSAVYLKRYEDLVTQAHFALCPNLTSHDGPLALCFSKCKSSLLDVALELTLKEGAHRHVTGGFRSYPSCGDEVSFDTTGYDIPASTISRPTEKFPYYHTSHDDFDNFMRPENQARHQELVHVMVGALRKIEENFSMVPLFRGGPGLANPRLGLYLETSSMSNMRLGNHRHTDLDGREIDLRHFMEFFLDALGTNEISVLEIAHRTNMPFAFVHDYAKAWVEKGLVRKISCNARRASSATFVETPLASNIMCIRNSEGARG